MPRKRLVFGMEPEILPPEVDMQAYSGHSMSEPRFVIWSATYNDDDPNERFDLGGTYGEYKTEAEAMAALAKLKCERACDTKEPLKTRYVIEKEVFIYEHYVEP